MTDQLPSFFRHLFRRAPAGSRATLFTIESTARRAHHLAPDPDALAALAAELDAKGGPDLGVYLVVCPTRAGLTKYQKGSADDVVQVPALWLDIDFLHPTHAAKNLPPDLLSAFSLIPEAGLPDPTMLVSSGAGLQPYWVLEEPLDVVRGRAALEALHARVRAAAERHGWHLDSVFNVDRVLRVPGTTNRKDLDEPRVSEILELSDRLHDLRDLVGASAPSASAQAPVRVQSIAPPSPSTGDAVGAGTPTIPVVEQLEITRRALARVQSDLTRQLARQLVAGVPFEMGQRDTDLARAAGLLSMICPPGTEAETIVELLYPSIDATVALQDDPRNPAPTREDALDKLGRAIKDARRKRERDQAAADGLARGLRRAARQSSRRAQEPSDQADEAQAEDEGRPYTAEELRLFEAEHGAPLRWIVQHAGSYYVLVNGQYQGPVVDKDLSVNLRRTLSPAPLDLTVWEGKQVRRMTTPEILFEYSTDAQRVVADLTVSTSHWDEDARTFYESCAPLRRIEPKYDERIHAWLRLLGGEQAHKLMDWIACVTLLKEQCAALYLTKQTGAGKSMLVAGLARLWGSEPTKLDNIVGNWTTDLTRCPLVVADEHLPPSWARSSTASAELRLLIGSSARALTRKFLPNATLVGAVRLVLIANDRNMLPTDESLGQNDLEAIGGRFLHIITSPAAANYLRSIGGKRGTHDWVDGDKIAAHALWLKENRVVHAGSRFIVEGDTKGVQEDLVIDTRIGSLVCEVIVRTLSDSRPLQGGAPAVRAGNNKLLVSSAGVADQWEHCVQSDQVQSTQRIGRQLSLMSGKMIETVKGHPYHVVNPAYVLRWADRYAVGDVGLMRAKIEGTVLDIHDGGKK